LKHRRLNAGRFALSGLAIATACLWGLSAHALGLGQLRVQSALGEPLRAEIDVTSLSAEEAGTLTLRVAPPDAYRAAGVDYNPVLPGTQVQLLKRADGRSYLRLTSDRAVVEPFVDVILEMNWASGRLVREYTLLLDPPATPRNLAAAPAPSVAPVISAAPSPAAPLAPAPRAAAPAAPAVAAAPAPERRAAPRPEAPPPAPRAAAAPAAAQAPAAAGGDQYRVRPGDSLSRIAKNLQPPSVSLDQMLVALFRGNPDAFVGNNMNRLKAGEVLTVPSAEGAKQIAEPEAREVIRAQSADFDAYRQQLASGVRTQKTDEPTRQAKGSVQAAVQDNKQAASPAPDKLTLSQGAVKGSAPEAAAAKEAEKKDNATRVAELSRNVDELKRLQGETAGAAGVATVAAGSSAPATPAAPVAAPAAASAAVPVVAAVPAAAAVPASAPVVVPAAPAAPPVAKAPLPAPAAAAEPGLLDSLTDNPLLLPGAGVLIALLAGLGAYRLRGRLRKGERETSFLESRLQPDSFFGASGGQRVDTHDASPSSSGSSASSMSYSLSQLDAIGDVDPVAEADVYLAYGRDLQAEEILKEAMRANPDRLAVRSKLLEVYAKRRDTKGFELLAGQLFALTGADSDDWHKAQDLGRQIDPDNPLYAPGGQPDMIVREGGRLVEPLGATTQPHSVQPVAVAGPITEAGSLEPSPRVDLDLDLDLDGRTSSDTSPGALEATRPFSTGAAILDDKPFSLDLPGASQPATASAGALDFDLGELTLDDDKPGAHKSGAAADDDFSASLPAFDLGGDDADPLMRKLELAEEFRQIGDTEGARDLLEEVVASADGALKTKAEGMLASLS
jgi:pilus assembly protein FimV